MSLFTGGLALATALAPAAVSGTANLIGASKQAGAQEDAAAAQLKANEEALAFEKQQAQYNAQETEVNRKANYDLMVAKAKKLGSLSQMLGLGGGPDIPAYVPGVTPNFTGSTPTAAQVTNAATSGLNSVLPPAFRPATPPAAKAIAPTLGSQLVLGQSPTFASSMPSSVPSDFGPIDPRTGLPIMARPQPLISSYLGA